MLSSRPQESLAQLRGLEPRAPPPLTTEEWVVNETKAIERGDADTCPICLDSLATSDQVILSCAHTFHANCLSSYEKFSRKRCCPVCRKVEYETRSTSVAAIKARYDAAMKIQSVVRQFAEQGRYKVKLRAHYEQGVNVNQGRKRAFYATEMATLANRVEASVQTRADTVDALFREFEESLRVSREVFSTETPKQPVGVRRGSLDKIDWIQCLSKNRARADIECGICLNPCKGSSCLLSCSHMFHESCIKQFEAFNVYEVLLCPMCRSPYERIDVNKVEKWWDIAAQGGDLHCIECPSPSEGANEGSPLGKMGSNSALLGRGRVQDAMEGKTAFELLSSM